MSIQFLSRAKAEIIGELAEPPSFADAANGGRYAKIKILTTEHFISKGERRVRKEIHDVTVFNKAGVDLLTNFGKPGVYFLVSGRLSNNKVEVSQFGGEIFVMTTGLPSTGSATASSTSSSSAPANTKTTGTAAASRSSGGLGRVVSRPAEADHSEDDGYPNSAKNSSSYSAGDDEDDEIPF